MTETVAVGVELGNAAGFVVVPNWVTNPTVSFSRLRTKHGERSDTRAIASHAAMFQYEPQEIVILTHEIKLERDCGDDLLVATDASMSSTS